MIDLTGYPYPIPKGLVEQLNNLVYLFATEMKNLKTRLLNVATKTEDEDYGSIA